MANKLKLLKNDLKKWNVEIFGNVEDWVRNLWKDLSVLELTEDSRVLLEEERLELERVQGKLEKATLMEEICWRQKSRVLCIREEDRNTKFFHRIANFHRRFNSIDRLMVDGDLSSNPEAIAGVISHFYRQLYTENVAHGPLLDDVEFSCISEEDALWLDRPFDEDKVFGVISDFKGDKALGLNGFSMAFFQSCWCILKAEIMAVFKTFILKLCLRRALMLLSLLLFPKGGCCGDQRFSAY